MPEIERGRSKCINSKLRFLVRRLEQRHASHSGLKDNWSYKDAAQEFVAECGCDYQVALKYFWCIEEAAKWRRILKRPLTLRDDRWLPDPNRLKKPKLP